MLPPHGVWVTEASLPRVNLRQITLLTGYIDPNEQPVVFIP